MSRAESNPTGNATTEHSDKEDASVEFFLRKHLLLRRAEESQPLKSVQSWLLVQCELYKSVLQTKDIGTIHWTPWSLRPFSLGCVALVSTALIMCIEILRRMSARNHGLAFYVTSDEIPYTVFFTYQYVPTIFATLFSTFWSMIDLDAKRMEPYSQIAKPDGGKIPFRIFLLDYVYSFPLKVPYLAFKRRHWRIVFTSSVFLIIILLLAPIQSALLGLQVESLSQNVTVREWSNLPPLRLQTQLFTSEAINQARSNVLGNEYLPSFTTERYAVSYIEFENPRGLNKSWKVGTRVYWSEPNCVNIADFQPRLLSAYQDILETTQNGSACCGPEFNFNSTSSRQVDVSVPASISRSPGCNLTLRATMMDLSQLAWEKVEPRGVELGEDGLLVEDSNCTDYTFWASYVNWSFNPNGNLPGSFLHNTIAALCKADYYSSPAEITFSENGTILAIDFQDVDPELLDANTLDIGSFEDSLGNSRDDTLNFTHDTLVFSDATSAFVDMNPFTLTDLIDAMIVHLDIDLDNLDWEHFNEAVTKSYRFASTLTFAHVLRNSAFNNVSSSRTVQAEYNAEHMAIAVNSFFATISEIILGLAIIVTLIDGVFYMFNRNISRHDPDSLASMLSLIATYIRGLKALDGSSNDLESASLRQYKHMTSSLAFSAEIDGTDPGFTICSGQSAIDDKPDKMCRDNPVYITTPKFLLSLAILLIIVVTMVILFALSSKLNFSYLAGSISLDAQALWQFTPTLVATGMGLGWLFVQRDLGVFEPWIQMSLGVPASNSLSLNYTSRIPELVVFRAIGKRHYLFAFVSFMLILNNVLSIVMGGLFSQTRSNIEMPCEVFDAYGNTWLPTLNTWPGDQWLFADAFELVRTSLSEDAPSPNRTVSSYFFLPLEDVAVFNTVIRDSEAFYSAPTQAISASLECTLLGNASRQTFENASEESTGIAYGDSLLNLEHKINYGLSGSHSPFPETVTPGSADFGLDIPDCFFVFSGSFGGPLEGPGAVFVKLFDYNNGSSKCDEYMLIMNHIADQGYLVQGEEGLYQNYTVEGTLCRPQILIEDAIVSIDTQKNIQSYLLNGLLNEEESSFGNLERHIQAFAHEFMYDKGLSWHNSNYSHGYVVDQQDRYDWPGLLTARAKNILQNATSEQITLANAASEVFGRTFAAFWELHHDQFLNVESSGSPTPATLVQTVTRMEPSKPAFTITIFIFLVYIVTAILVYMKRRALVTPRMPNSIGSILPWVAHSRILKDFEGTAYLSSSSRDEFLDSLDKIYMFGWFRDEEGTLRLGLEESRYVERPWKPDS